MLSNYPQHSFANLRLHHAYHRCLLLGRRYYISTLQGSSERAKITEIMHFWEANLSVTPWRRPKTGTRNMYQPMTKGVNRPPVGNLLRVGLQHLLSMLARSLGQLSPAQHAGDFFGALLAGNEADRSAGAVGSGFLFDQIMMVGEGCDLRQVSYAEHLIGSRQCLQLFAHGFSRA